MENNSERTRFLVCVLLMNLGWSKHRLGSHGSLGHWCLIPVFVSLLLGNSLVKLGSAHSQIATLQEAYALTFKDTFLASMEKFRDEIKECELLRKKLDGRKYVFVA